MKTLHQEVEKIRAIRQAISKECGYDPHRLMEFYRKKQKEHQDKYPTPTAASSRVRELPPSPEPGRQNPEGQ